MPTLRPLNPSNDKATRPNDRRDFRVFWVHESRDAKGVKWSGGERRARKRFARLIAGGRMGKGEALAEAIRLHDDKKPRPPSWTEEDWKKHWSANRLRLISERWLLHPFVQEEARRQKKIAAAQAALRAGLPDEVLAEIATGKEYSPRDRTVAAMALAKANQRHGSGVLIDFTEAAREARARHEDDEPKQAKEEADGPPSA